MMPAEVPHHHPNVALISIISILIGLIAGAAGMFYGKEYILQMIPAGLIQQAQAPAQEQVADQAAQQEQAAQQAQAGAAAEAYTSVDTNPLGDVQTNPF